MEYRRHIEKDAALARRFGAVEVEEPGQETAVEILQGLAPRYAAHHGVEIAPEAVRAAVTLSARYLPERFLPDKALDLLDERERTVIVLRFFQELKLQEIAQVTGENVNTVKTILYRSLKKLKLELSEGGPIRESRPSRSSETGI